MQRESDGETDEYGNLRVAALVSRRITAESFDRATAKAYYDAQYSAGYVDHWGVVPGRGSRR
ncbi:MAG: hypothetical protein H0U59_07400 [Gemmatimonadaceae bacterium]|nr:hypothetical protein [Gemmatimonadaceae bacterium]